MLAERFGKEPGVHDIVWSIFNELLLRTTDFQDQKSLHYSMALFLADEGRDPYRMLQQASRAELMHYKNSGAIDKVKILASGNGCAECESLGGTILDIDQALNEMPIPNKECTYKSFSKKHSFCRCCYVAHFDDWQDILFHDPPGPYLFSLLGFVVHFGWNCLAVNC